MSDVAHLSRRLAALEGESAVRRVVASYFALCDDLGPHTPIDELADLFTRQAIWEGKGRYEQAFGRYEGRSAIRAMLWSYCDPPHFAMTQHFHSSERIEAGEADGSGRWMMLQTSTYADGRSDLRSAELTLRFAVEDGAWRIAHFRSLNLFSRRIDHWIDSADIPVPPKATEGCPA